MSVCTFNAISSTELSKWPYFLFITVRNILIPLKDVFNKVLITDKFLLPLFLMFIRGVIDLLFLIILFLIIIVFRDIINFELFNIVKQTYQIIDYICKIILYFCQAFCLLKVLDIFTPWHFVKQHSVYIYYFYVD